MKKGIDKKVSKRALVLPKEEEIMKKIGERLKELRKGAGYENYENFAFDNEISRVHYGRMEKGTNFTIKSLLRILSIHKVGLGEFFKEIK